MPNKRIVLCMDGTWNNPYQKHQREDGSRVLKPSNPLKMARSVTPVDGTTEQVTYYHAGVGSLGTYPGLSNKILEVVDSKLGGGYLATKDDLPAYLASLGLPAGKTILPDDVLQAIATRRKAMGR